MPAKKEPTENDVWVLIEGPGGENYSVTLAAFRNQYKVQDYRILRYEDGSEFNPRTAPQSTEDIKAEKEAAKAAAVQAPVETKASTTAPSTSETNSQP